MDNYLILKKNCSLFSAPVDYPRIPEKGPLDLVAEPMNIPTPFSSSKFEPQVLGSCEGLLCLCYPERCILWNPTTRTHHVIRSELTTHERTQMQHGLGYHKRRDDFKLVKFVQFMGPMGDDHDDVWNHDTEVWVYSLNSGSWHHVLEEANWFVPFGFTDVFVNGALHFKLIKNQRSAVAGEGSSTRKAGEFLIVAFDVAKETCKVMANPDCIENNSKFELGVLDFPLSLCMLVKGLKGESEVETFRFLQMRLYGDASSWAELFRFVMDDGPRWMRPITFVGRDTPKHVLLEGQGELYCYDVGSDSFKDVQIKGVDCDDFYEVCVCKLRMFNSRILDTVDVVEQVPRQEAGTSSSPRS